MHSISEGFRFPPPARTSDTLVFTCTYNERGSIDALLDGLLGLKTRCDILVVDDSSQDGTLDRLAARAAADPRIGVLVRPRKLGIGSAHMLGWLHATRMGYSRFATIDADLSHDPADVERLLESLDAGADVAIGSRFAAGAKLDYQGYRRAVSRAANALSTALLRLSISEHTTSLRAVKVERVPPGLIEAINIDGFAFSVSFIVRLARAGLSIVEVPIHFRDRHHGVSKIAKRELVYGVANLLRLAVARHDRVVHASDNTDCVVCGRPYQIRDASGRFRCLACFGSTRSIDAE